MLRCLLLVALVMTAVSGCGEAEKPLTVAKQIKSVPHSDAINAALATDDPLEKFAVIWPFTVSRAKTSHTLPASSSADTPIECSVVLANKATEWSTATVKRQLKPDTYKPNTMYTLGSFLYDLDWGPTSHFAVNPPTESGKTDLLEWTTEDLSTDELHHFVVKFRLKSKTIP